MAQLPLDFVSPYPLNACTSRLRERIKTLRKSSPFVRNVPVRMESFPMPIGTYRLEIQRDVYSYIYVEVICFLKPQENETLVIGRSGFPLFAKIIAFIFFCAGLYLSYRYARPDIVVIFGVVLVIQFVWGKAIQNELLQMVENALRYKDY